MSKTRKALYILGGTSFDHLGVRGRNVEEVLRCKVNVALARILQKSLLMLRWHPSTPLADSAYADAANCRQILKAAETAKYVLYNLLTRSEWLLSHEEDV